MTILPYGDSALLLNFEQKITPSIHRKVRNYEIEIQKLAGIKYLIPAYASITVVFDMNLTSYQELKSKIENIKPTPAEQNQASRLLKVPVCYENDYAPDLQSVATQLSLDTEEIVRLHTAEIYDLYMMGFLPGFPYLGKLPSQLKCERKQNPRTSVPTGSVGLAGLQTGIYPFEAPGGWQLIGQTPLKIIDFRQEDPFFFKPGDQVQFYSIDSSEFKSLLENEK